MKFGRCIPFECMYTYSMGRRVFQSTKLGVDFVFVSVLYAVVNTITIRSLSIGFEF